MILAGLNATRTGTGIRISRFSLFVGLLVLTIRVAGILGFSLDLLITVVILIGLFRIGEYLGGLFK